MPKTIKTLLTDALEDLSDSQLKKFRNQLTDRREEPRVRRGTVQNADYMDLADVMVSTFTEDGVIKVAVELLTAIGCNDLATDLEKRAPESSGGASSATNMVGGMQASKKHFVDQHRSDLIQRVNMVAAILDDLLDKKVINLEGYNMVMSKATNQDKMRELFNGPLNSSGTSGKDVFFKILMEKETFLLDDLNS